MTIAIVVVSFQRASATARCIASLRENTEHPYKIFLVDNGSTESRTHELLDSLSSAADIKLFRLTQNRGPSAARNVALKSLPTGWKFVALLDNDVTALRGWDSAAFRAFESGADMIQPKLLKADGRTVDRGPNRPNPSPLAINPEFVGRGMDALDPSVCTEQDAQIVGTAAMLRRSVLESVGFFDDDLHIGEDFDLSFRAKEAGFSLRYVPTCVLIHDHVFDLEYDQERARPEKYLKAHVVLWRRWRKALLSPRYMYWYRWLHLHGEPMYMPTRRNHWRLFHRRLRRRLTRDWFVSRYPNQWSSFDLLKAETETLVKQLALMEGENDPG